mmetsp:Transcript_16247/g.29279  ORF Transcript_16247/g.29279 Transcript_16247/m.29279 type:complete len:84 (-) Transcript_16247:328-579(-)
MVAVIESQMGGGRGVIGVVEIFGTNASDIDIGSTAAATARVTCRTTRSDDAAEMGVVQMLGVGGEDWGLLRTWIGGRKRSGEG